MANNEVAQLKDFASQQRVVKETEESSREEVVVISDRMRRMQHEMRVLYEKQLKIDGIILPKVDEVIVLAVSLTNCDRVYRFQVFIDILILSSDRRRPMKRVSLMKI